MNLQEHFDLSGLNTLAVRAKARWYLEVHQQADLISGLRFAGDRSIPWMVLGGGSNLLFIDNFPGLVLHIRTRGIQVEPLCDRSALITVAAGENWHDFVEYTLRLGLAGLENLSLIPGTVGAAPIQNIGAYGVEVKDCLETVHVLDTDNGCTEKLSREGCRFNYRDSIFKMPEGEHYIITAVTFRLSRDKPVRISYGDLQQRLAEYPNPSPMDVSRVICQVRREKLPDPVSLPNAGSFFKNPVIDEKTLAAIQANYPEVVFFRLPDGLKLAAAWLIDQCGWKGYGDTHAGVHHRQALVLVNRGQATGADILALARRIQASVVEKFGISLVIEPVIRP